MLPAPQPRLQASDRRLLALRAAGIALGSLALAWGAPATAQVIAPFDGEAQEPAAGEREVAFEADEVTYDSERDVITVSGNVILRSAGQSVRADSVTWDRRADQIVAVGNIRFVDEDGNQLFGDRLVLTGNMRLGAMENMLLVLREGGRLAAREGERLDDGRIALDHAAYSACAVVDEAGCPKKPSWRVVATRVIYDPDEDTVRFVGAKLELFGLPILPLPGLMVPTDGRAVSGVTIPNLRISASNGVEISEGYYWRLGTNRDLIVTGYAYTQAPPMIGAQYRSLGRAGAFQVGIYATRSSRIAIGPSPGTQQHDWRGYYYGNGRWQFGDDWTLTASVRVASDRTFLRRYDISRDDRLRSMVEAERITDNSYLTIAGWATQTLRSGDPQGQVPIALPVVDYRRRFDDPFLGGKLELQLNTLAITRTAGQDTQRAFAGATWNLKRITSWGQEVTLTALLRGDIYHSDENGLTATAIYRGNPGWQTRAVAVAAIDAKWPFVGEIFGGTQVLTPRVQIVASPPVRNLAVPNEDARAIDLEDSNLFALNRFPGYDRIEDGVRFTWGLDWQFEAPGLRIKTTFGQSFRLTSDPTLLPDGTGLSERVSDWVGRTEMRYKDFIKLTHRFRLDKDSLAIRRNEFDATIGSSKTYLEIGYLRLNRDISVIEDLQDREELRFAGRVGFARYWSIFGSGVINLTDRNEDPTLSSDGFEPLRTRLGVAYADDCLELGLTWRRDYAASGDARRGNTFQIYLALKNLGF